MDKRYVVGFWAFVVLLFAVGILGPMHERSQREALRKAKREASEARIKAFDKPLKTIPWIVCNGEGANQSCVVYQLPGPQQ